MRLSNINNGLGIFLKISIIRVMQALENNVSIESLLNILEGIDWSFSDHSSSGHITSLHPYPARFIPMIPNAIIKAVKPYYGELNILDPFAGCGTVLSEAIASGCSTIGIDVNGLANFLQKAYTAQISEKNLAELIQIVNRLENEHSFDTLVSQHHLDIPNLKHWFDEDTISIVSTAINIINASSDENAKMLGLLGVSRSLVSLSRQKSDTQYVAIEKSHNKYEKLKVLVSSIKTVEKQYRKLGLTTHNKALCILGDSRDPKSYNGIKKVNLVITSPPYPNAYEYWLYHKYRMYWMGMDPIWSREKEIGVRPHYSGSGKKDEWDFYKDIKLVLQNIDSVTTKDALQFWVVGDSIIKGRAIDNTKIIIDAANEVGWKKLAIYQRPINRKKSSFQGIGKKQFEDVIVLTR